MTTYSSSIDSVISMTKALADPGRLRVLLVLQQRELCVCQMVELLGLAPSTVSKHLAVLKQAGLVRSRKNGRWVYYRAAVGQSSEVVSRTLEWVRACCSCTCEAMEDSRRVAEIVSLELETLCRRQNCATLEVEVDKAGKKLESERNCDEQRT